MDDKNKDLLQKILIEDENHTSHEAEELLDFIENIGKELSHPEKNKSDDGITTGSKKVRRTYYLKKDLLNLLYLAEKKCREIKEKNKRLRSIRISKSKIVNIALELLLNDFVSKGESSFLFKRLFSK